MWDSLTRPILAEDLRGRYTFFGGLGRGFALTVLLKRRSRLKEIFEGSIVGLLSATISRATLFGMTFQAITMAR